MIEYHGCKYTWKGDWRLLEISSRPIWIMIPSLVGLLSSENLQKISIRDIAWKFKDFPPNQRGPNCPCCNGERYFKTNPEHPIIILPASNPLNLLYRCIDGKHRAERIRDSGSKTLFCYVLTLEEIKPSIIYDDPYK